MNKEMVAFIVIFLMLIGAGIYQGNADQITPNVAQAQADLSIGAAPVQVLEKGATWLLKLIGGAAFAGTAAAIFTELRKNYKLWQRNSQMKRWQPGPNAQWQPQQPKVQSLTRMDQLLLALAGRLPEANRITPKVVTTQPASHDEDIDLEF